MSTSRPWLIPLKWILIATFLSSVLHYVDNILFFAHYPEPNWLNPKLVDLFWFVMTPLAPLGFYAIKKGHHNIGAMLLIAYGACNMLTLGHYKFAPLESIAVKIHLFIALEAIMGCILIGYILLLYKNSLRTVTR